VDHARRVERAAEALVEPDAPERDAVDGSKGGSGCIVISKVPLAIVEPLVAVPSGRVL
jgi:hypothetical protein